MIAITYHEEYNKYDLGVDHPLVGDKPKKTLDFFMQKQLMKECDLLTVPLASEQDLLRVHSSAYVNKIKQLSKTGGMLSLDTPAPPGIYEYARRATGGTVLCGRKLYENYDITVNPLGGFHHAGRENSSGFCFFNDIAVVIEYLRKTFNLERCAVVDVDVHHGNGTQEIYYDDPSVLTISLHQDGRTLYPGTGALEKIGRDKGEGYTVNLPLPPGTGSQSYLSAFTFLVPPLIEQFQPEVLIYQSGVDTHHSDPLADLQLTFSTYYHLAQTMKELASRTCEKLLVLFGGGYNSDASVKAYYNITCGLMGKSSIITEQEQHEIIDSQVQDNVRELQRILSPFWTLQ